MRPLSTSTIIHASYLLLSFILYQTYRKSCIYQHGWNSINVRLISEDYRGNVRMEIDFDFVCFVVELSTASLMKLHRFWTPNRAPFCDKARKIKIYFLINAMPRGLNCKGLFLPLDSLERKNSMANIWMPLTMSDLRMFKRTQSHLSRDLNI